MIQICHFGKIVLVLLGGLLAQSCVSGQLASLTPDEVVAVEGILGTNCKITSSSYQVTIFDPSFGTQHLDLDLVITAPTGWELDGSDLLGRELFHLTYINGGFTNRYSRGLPLNKLGVGPTGYLDWEGQFLPVKADDITSILTGCFPVRWQKLDWKKVSQSEAATVIRAKQSSDHESEIEVSLLSKGEFCAEISWKMILGLVRQEVAWCQTSTQARRSGSLKFSGTNGSHISWKLADFQAD